MHMQMNTYSYIYSRLLADISRLSEVPLGAPGDLGDEWYLIKAPKLDKQILGYLEGWNQELDFPEWLLPLWERFLVDKSPLILRYIRQLLVFCYKIETEPTNNQLNEAIEGFINTEGTVAVYDTYLGSIATHVGTGRTPFLSEARRLISRICAKVNLLDIVPHHGPGSVFPNRVPWKKTMFSTCYSSIERYYPWGEFFQIGLMSGLYEPLEDKTPVSDEIVASLVAVPKDSRGPRLICVHPAEAIWIQQGQRRVLEDAITSHPWTRGSIRFEDQSVNGAMALSSSSSGAFCTLDLKEASDHVSKGLVRYLFGEYMYDILSCTRATHVRLPDGRKLELQKWAPMGNCLTFPVESLVFWSLVQAGIIYETGRMSRDVYVFGDDIIFPTKYYTHVLRSLCIAGLVPNFTKTFRHGLFRESCGVDAFNGVDITPVRMKKGSVTCAENAQAFCSLAFRLRAAGYEQACVAAYHSVEEWLGHRLEIVNDPDASGIVEYRHLPLSALLVKYDGTKTLRFNHALQRWEIRHLKVTPRLYKWSDIRHDRCHVLHGLTDLHGRNCFSQGLQYVIPYSQRSTYGWTGLHWI